jgi:hypothetical protein
MDRAVEYYSEALESFAVLIILLSMILPIFSSKSSKYFTEKLSPAEVARSLALTRIISKPSATFKIASTQIYDHPSPLHRQILIASTNLTRPAMRPTRQVPLIMIAIRFEIF